VLLTEVKDTMIGGERQTKSAKEQKNL